MIPCPSVNGPSLTVNFPELIRIRAPFVLGSNPSVPTSTPAWTMSCISFPMASISFGLGGSFVSGFPDLYNSANLMSLLLFCGRHSTSTLSPACEANEKKQEGGATQGTSHSMQTSPPIQQLRGLPTTRIERRVKQPVIGWQNHHKSERHGRSEKNRTRSQPAIAGCPRGPQARDAAHDRQQCLHDRRPTVAWSEFSKCHVRAAGEPGRMLDCIDVDRSTGKNASAHR